jgi:hypothetical protein
MTSHDDKIRRRQRLNLVKETGKALLKLRSSGIQTTVLRESRVAAAGWPDYLVSGLGGRTACVSLCMEDGNENAATDLFLGEEMPGSVPALAARLREVAEAWRLSQPQSRLQPALVVLCPQWAEASLRRSWPGLTLDGVRLAGQEFCSQGRLEDLIEQLPASSAADADLLLLRAFLAPETLIQPPPTPAERRRQTREHQISLLPQLLDYDQDLCAKMDLWLPDEGRDTAENFSLRLVTGAAGTGKSVVLVHRAAMLRQFYPEAHIAVLTHNTALRADLESRYQRMSGSGGVEFLTFYSWLGRRFKSRAKIVKDEEAAGLLPVSDVFTPQFLRDEFDWIHDQGLQSLDDYLAAERTGRTKGLREPQRRALYALLEEYRQRLDARGLTDWSRRAFDALTMKPRGPLYDFILVDEAQFFARTWVQLIRNALRPGGHLFLCADPAQGFLGRGQSWREAGLEVKGRSHVLKRPYRNTRQILSFAASRYQQYVLDDEEAPRLQETTCTAPREGPEPAEILVASPQDEIVAVIRQAQQLTESGAPPRDLLILCARRRQVNEIGKRLTAQGLTSAALNAPAAERQDRILLGTMDGATGLERPIVILCGMREFSNHEENPSLPEDERRRHRRLNASRLYMACTRATQRLVIVSCGKSS